MGEELGGGVEESTLLSPAVAASPEEREEHAEPSFAMSTVLDAEPSESTILHLGGGGSPQSLPYASLRSRAENLWERRYGAS